MSSATGRRELLQADRPPLARGPVLAATVAAVIALSITSARYGYGRDELYFAMLPAQWGYVDQPPLTPLIAQFFSTVVADAVWAVRIPATAIMASSIVVVTEIARELGGGRRAQSLCAWAYGSSLLPLLFGHVLLTATLDLLVWPAVILFTMRAVLRNRGQWWMAVGLVVGLSMYNKLLVAMLLVSLAAAMLAVGPRRVLWSRWVVAGVAVALVVGSPNLIYQMTHDWPQLTMGRALAANNAAEVRVAMWPFLLVIFGPPLVPVWCAGSVALLRRPRWRSVRYVAVAFPILLLLVFLAGSQFYYPFGLMTALFAAGCVVVADWSAGSRARHVVVVAAVVLNAGASALIALPVVPVDEVGSTPIPAMNQLVQDQVGWPTYVRQVADVAAALPPAESAGTVVVASNYGEAGAIDRFGPAMGITQVFSPHNELYFVARPPATARTAIVVGASIAFLRPLFASCEIAGVLDNRVAVDNEEQGRSISICRAPVGGWQAVWPAMQHYD